MRLFPKFLKIMKYQKLQCASRCAQTAHKLGLTSRQPLLELTVLIYILCPRASTKATTWRHISSSMHYQTRESKTSCFLRNLNQAFDIMTVHKVQIVKNMLKFRDQIKEMNKFTNSQIKNQLFFDKISNRPLNQMPI